MSSKEVQRLEATKADRIKVQQGLPANHEGRNGDLSVRQVPSGLGLYGKFNGKWYKIGKLEDITRDGQAIIGRGDNKEYNSVTVNKDLIVKKGSNGVRLKSVTEELKVRDSTDTADAPINASVGTFNTTKSDSFRGKSSQNTITFGSGAAVLQSTGDANITIQTGNDDTGSIVITDGADQPITITPNGTGSVVLSKVDINGGTIDAADVTVGSGKELDVSAGTMTFAANQISLASLANVSPVSRILVADGSGDIRTSTTAASTAEYLNTTAGTVTASKCVVVDANSRIDKLYLDGPAGFVQKTEAWDPVGDASLLDIDFNLTNKVYLTPDASGETVLLGRLIFPAAISGNFVLIFKQHSGAGSDVQAWSAHNATSGGSGTLWWNNGGTKPSLTPTASLVDILSFYWDASTSYAYGSYVQGFQS